VLPVTAVIDLAPELSFSGNLLAIKSQQLLLFIKSKMCLWECSVSLQSKAQCIEYKIVILTRSISVLDKNQKPSIPYASCNGFSDPKLMK
jgi:hypothetical protein